MRIDMKLFWVSLGLTTLVAAPAYPQPGFAVERFPEWIGSVGDEAEWTSDNVLLPEGALHGVIKSARAHSIDGAVPTIIGVGFVTVDDGSPEGVRQASVWTWDGSLWQPELLPPLGLPSDVLRESRGLEVVLDFGIAVVGKAEDEHGVIKRVVWTFDAAAGVWNDPSQRARVRGDDTESTRFTVPADSGSSSGSGVIHVVEQIGTTFVPADITVQPGDTIMWNWSLGNHTVTSGTPCTPDGLFFDEVLDSVNPQVSFVVPDDGTTFIPYFCIPHCLIAMTGTITVESVGIPCSDILRFKAKCANDGRILTRLILSTPDHDGETVTISVDGVPFVTTINGRVVRLVVNEVSGVHTVSLDDPSGCRAPQDVVCP